MIRNVSIGRYSIGIGRYSWRAKTAINRVNNWERSLHSDLRLFDLAAHYGKTSVYIGWSK